MMRRRIVIAAGITGVGLVAGPGLWAGMVLGGWRLWSPPFADLHGHLVVMGFLGTLIGMERALAHRSGWAWAWPAGTLVASAALVAGLPRWVGGGLLGLTGMVQLAVVIAGRRHHLVSHVALMTAASGGWIVAAWGLVVDLPTADVVPAMAVYLVLTVVAVRLELIGARSLAPSNVVSRVLLFAAALAALAGSVAAVLPVRAGVPAVGVALFTIAVWLLISDLPRRLLRLGGLGRQMSITLLTGYVWLGASGVAWAAGLLTPGTPTYGPAVHGVFLGFVVSMMMAHAPVVVPMMANRHVVAWPRLTVPLAVLHASLAIRIVGDLTGVAPISRWGGVGTAIALAVIGGQAVVAVARSRALAPIPEIYIP